MHFAHSQHASGSRSTKLVLVIVFHLILGIALVKTMNVRLLAPSAAPAPLSLLPFVDPPPVQSAPVTPQHNPLPVPRIVVPMPELPPPVATQASDVTAATFSDPAPVPSSTGPLAIAPANPGLSASTGTAPLRSAAMLDGCTKPAYPAQSARNGDSGTVTLALLVGVDGHVSSARVERSSGFRELDKAALTALSRCTFKPALLGDVAQAGWTQLAYVWTLE